MKQLQSKLHLLEKTTYFLILLFLPTQLGKHFWPSWSQVLGLRIDYLSPTVYLTDIFIILLFTVWAINKFSNSKFPPAIAFAKRWRAGQILLIAVVLIIGIISSKNSMSGWYGLVKLLEFIFFGWYTAGHIKRISDVAVPLAIGIVFESMLAFLQVFTQGSIGGIFYWFGERTFSSQTPGIANASLNGALFFRPYATFSHPNVLAGYLTIAMAMVISNFKFPPAIAFAKRWRAGQISNKTKLFYSAVLVLGTAALFLTLSRVAILLWIAMLIVTFLMRRRVVLIAFFLIASAIVLFFTPLPSRFLQTSLTDESLQLRISLSKSAFLMILDHPIFGVGLHNFIPSLPSYQHTRTTSLFSVFQPVHNIYLLIASETGLIGLGLFLWFIKITYVRLKLSTFNSQLSTLTIVLILGMLDHYFLTLQQGQLLFAFVIGLCWSRS